MCARLARLYFEPSRRAAALYRQAEILRDAAGQSDGGAGGVPALIGSRIRASFRRACVSSITSGRWAISMWSPSSPTTSTPSRCQPENESDLVARLAIATTTLRGGAHVALPVHRPRWRWRPRARSWRRQAIRSTSKQPRHRGARFDADARPDWAGTTARATLYQMLTEMVREDPGQPGAGRRAGPVRRDGRPPRAGAGRLRARRLRRARVLRPRGTSRGSHRPGTSSPRPSRSAAPPTIPTSTFRRAGRWPASRRHCSASAPTSPRRNRRRGAGLPPARAAELRRIGDSIGAPAVHRRPRRQRRHRGRRAPPPARDSDPAGGAADWRVGARNAERAVVVVRRGPRAGDAAQRPAHVGPGRARKAWRGCSRARAPCWRTPRLTSPRPAPSPTGCGRRMRCSPWVPPEARAQILAHVEAALAALPDW